MTFTTPILVIIFNRPAETRRVIERISSIGPSRLYIASDGPRTLSIDEDKIVEKTRRLAIDNVSKNCDINTLFHEENLGCKRAVTKALDWFFANESEGIIIEDDCLPDRSFFQYCEELLERYRDEHRVGMISGDNFQFNAMGINESYYFSRYSHVWGWATWRRVWELYRQDKGHWDQVKNDKLLEDLFEDQKELKYWKFIFDKVYDNEIDTWDYQLNLTLWANRMLSILPSTNLVTNIGFGSNATHTKSVDRFANLSSSPLPFPLDHPKAISRNIQADQRYHEIAHPKNLLAYRMKLNLGQIKKHVLKSINLRNKR